jgi:hypothetical protein
VEARVSAGAVVQPFSLPTEQEEINELSAFGVKLSVEGALEIPDAQAAIDASASQLMREIGRLDASIERYVEAGAEEHRLVTMRTETLTSTLIERKARLESIVRSYAALSSFGDKKSRELPFGTYGTRLKPDTFSITDDGALLSWAKKQKDEIKAKLVSWTNPKPKDRVLNDAAKTYFVETGDMPEGCEFTPAHDEPFVNVEIPTVLP